MPLVQLSTSIPLLRCEVQGVPIFLLLEEERLLGSCRATRSLDEDLHDALSHVHKADVLKSRGDDEGEPLLIEARQRGQVIFVDVTCRILQD